MTAFFVTLLAGRLDARSGHRRRQRPAHAATCRRPRPPSRRSSPARSARPSPPAPNACPCCRSACSPTRCSWAASPSSWRSPRWSSTCRRRTTLLGTAAARRHHPAAHRAVPAGGVGGRRALPRHVCVDGRDLGPWAGVAGTGDADGEVMRMKTRAAARPHDPQGRGHYSADGTAWYDDRRGAWFPLTEVTDVLEVRLEDVGAGSWLASLLTVLGTQNGAAYCRFTAAPRADQGPGWYASPTFTRVRSLPTTYRRGRTGPRACARRSRRWPPTCGSTAGARRPRAPHHDAVQASSAGLGKAGSARPAPVRRGRRPDGARHPLARVVGPAKR